MKNRLERISRTLVLFTLLASSPVFLIAQEEAAQPQEEKKDTKPVRSPFQANSLIESQTYVVFAKKTLVLDMQHRFGPMNNSNFDLFGIYGPSNIRLALTYVVLDNFQLGAGTTKNGMIQDINWKYSILRQTRSNSMPIALTYYGNWAYSAVQQSSFGAESEYKGTHRMSYFNQLILGRKFGKKVAVQVMANYAHFNQIDTLGNPDFKHDNLGIGFGGRYQFSPQGSIMFECEQPLTTPEHIKPNVSFGVEFATSSHAFQLFITTYSGIVYQYNMVYNTNEVNQNGLLIGFNFTRNWSF